MESFVFMLKSIDYLSNFIQILFFIYLFRSIQEKQMIDRECFHKIKLKLLSEMRNKVTSSVILCVTYSSQCEQGGVEHAEHRNKKLLPRGNAPFFLDEHKFY